jgi:hypothetical protein
VPDRSRPQVEEACEVILVVEDWESDGHTSVRIEQSLDKGAGFVEVGAWIVQFGHHDGACQACSGHLAPEVCRGLIDPIGGTEDEDRGPRGCQSGPLLDEVPRVNDVDVPSAQAPGEIGLA